MTEPRELHPYSLNKKPISQPSDSPPKQADPDTGPVELKPVQFLSSDPEADENLYDFRIKPEEAAPEEISDPKDLSAAEHVDYSDLIPE